MKIRNGFVSNSSSTSFLIKGEKFPDVFAFLTHILPKMIEFDADYYGPTDDITKEHQELLKRINTLRNLGVDPNMPVEIPLIEGVIRVAKHKDGYYFDNVYAYADIDQGEFITEGNALEGNFFYQSNLDIIAKDLPYDTDFNCGVKAHKDYIKMVEYTTGERFCTACGIEDKEEIRVTVNPEKYTKLEIPIEINRWWEE